MTENTRIEASTVAKQAKFAAGDEHQDAQQLLDETKMLVEQLKSILATIAEPLRNPLRSAKMCEALALHVAPIAQNLERLETLRPTCEMGFAISSAQAAYSILMLAAQTGSGLPSDACHGVVHLLHDAEVSIERESSAAVH